MFHHNVAGSSANRAGCIVSDGVERAALYRDRVTGSSRLSLAVECHVLREEAARFAIVNDQRVVSVTAIDGDRIDCGSRSLIDQQPASKHLCVLNGVNDNFLDFEVVGASGTGKLNRALLDQDHIIAGPADVRDHKRLAVDGGRASFGKAIECSGDRAAGGLIEDRHLLTGRVGDAGASCAERRAAQIDRARDDHLCVIRARRLTINLDVERRSADQRQSAGLERIGRHARIDRAARLKRHRSVHVAITRQRRCVLHGEGAAGSCRAINFERARVDTRRAGIGVHATQCHCAGRCLRRAVAAA